MILLSTTDVFQNKFFFRNNISGILSGCQMVRFHIRNDVLSVLIWIQTVCIGYQHTTKVNTSKEIVNKIIKALHMC